MGRVSINGTVVRFSCKQSIPKTFWKVTGNKAKGKNRKVRGVNLAFDTIEDFDKNYANFLKRTGKDRGIIGTYKV